MGRDEFDRIAVVVHPTRGLDRALAALRTWTAEQGAELVQLHTPGQDREVAPAGDARSCDLVIALGGDGTTLAALHAAAAVDRPVLGVACGSLGALTAVTADRIGAALDRVAAGDWHARDLPAVRTRHGDATLRALNDLVLVRRGAGQVSVGMEVDGAPFARISGDGLVVATPIGSTAYTLAAGGPMLAPGTAGIVLTPLAPHGGVCPPLVVAPGTPLVVTLHPGNGGARVEVDGQVRVEVPALEPVAFALEYEPRYGQLISLGDDEALIAGLRRRRIILDSPRVLARDDREAAAAEAARA